MYFCIGHTLFLTIFVLAIVNNTIYIWQSEKNMELHLLVLWERKNIFLARQIPARQRGTVMAFIPNQIIVRFNDHR